MHLKRCWRKIEKEINPSTGLDLGMQKIDCRIKKIKRIIGTKLQRIPKNPTQASSELLKDMKEREYELNKYSTDRIKFVEKGGVKIEQMLTNKNPFENKRCSDKWCPLCKGDYGEIKIPCNTNNAGYRWICKTCEKDKKVAKVYEGETSRSIRIRTMEHIAGYRNKISSNVLYKHKTLEHINEKVEYKL